MVDHGTSLLSADQMITIEKGDEKIGLPGIPIGVGRQAIWAIMKKRRHVLMSSEVRQILTAVRSLCEKDKEELVSELDRELHGSPSPPNRDLIDAIRGKYAHLPTSSAGFISRKSEDVVSEHSPSIFPQNEH